MDTDFYIGAVGIFAGNFTIRNFAACNGQLIPITQNTALFSIIGTIYGGDGRTTFALPDLRGRSVISQGRGPGLQTYTIGQQGGQEFVTLNAYEMPSHNHTIQLVAGGADTTVGVNHAFAANSTGDTIYTDQAVAGLQMNSAILTNAGGNQSHENRSPLLTMNYLICMQGVFPPRN